MNRSAPKASPPRRARSGGNTKTIAIVAGALVAVVGGAGIGLALNGNSAPPASGPAPVATSAAPQDVEEAGPPEAESPPDVAADGGEAPAVPEDVQDDVREDTPVASGGSSEPDDQGSGSASGQQKPALKPTKKPAARPTQAPQEDPDVIDRTGDAGAVEPGGPIGGY
ncbi:hypothetical protein [Herbidospora cretacea]|uniref:hypothetical protein n=1 Tax=Herbidospora cretacea TaxID=28444 RepID=UPI000772FE5B|nr:hypothetical protein [Herbidospora cretacea]